MKLISSRYIYCFVLNYFLLCGDYCYAFPVGDDEGAGATVLEKGTTNGMVTDSNGCFTLTVPDDAVLIISYMGYKTLEIPSKGHLHRRG